MILYVHWECGCYWQNRGGRDEVMSGLCATLKNLHFILEMLESVKPTHKIRFAVYNECFSSGGCLQGSEGPFPHE